MPKLNGWEVLKRLKTENNTRNIPVIMLTGESDRKKSFLLGASDFIIKPDEVNREKILGMVEKHLELH
jgi:CheY-like chemotaxis protein